MSTTPWTPHVLLLATFLALYLFPTLVALLRGHPRVGMLFLCNLLFGWTVFSWLLCFLWAVWPISWGDASSGSPWLVREVSTFFFPPRDPVQHTMAPWSGDVDQSWRRPVPPPRTPRARHVPPPAPRVPRARHVPSAP